MIFTVGDTAPALTGTCQQTTGDGCDPTIPKTTTPANLTGAAIELHIEGGNAGVITKTPAFVSAEDGTWIYDWQIGDLNTSGVYTVEAQVTYADGKIQTFGPAPFRVQPQIG